MAEAGSFLEEHLERVRQMTERMAEVSSRVAEACERITRDREALQSDPLHAVRDFRTRDIYDPRAHDDDLDVLEAQPRRRRHRRAR